MMSGNGEPLLQPFSCVSRSTTSGMNFTIIIIAEISTAAAQANNPNVPFSGYYKYQLVSLEKVLTEKGIICPTNSPLKSPKEAEANAGSNSDN